MNLKIKYHANIDRLEYIGGSKSNWIDLRCAENVFLREGEFRIISLGISVKLPPGYEALIAPRSSTFKSFGIIMVNSIGIIDESYCGDNDIWGFPALATRDVYIPANERIAQFRIMEHQPDIVFHKVDRMENPDRGGFGSTGR